LLNLWSVFERSGLAGEVNFLQGRPEFYPDVVHAAERNGFKFGINYLA
jgi:hypothetical protein